MGSVCQFCGTEYWSRFRLRRHWLETRCGQWAWDLEVNDDAAKNADEEERRVTASLWAQGWRGAVATIPAMSVADALARRLAAAGDEDTIASLA